MNSQSGAMASMPRTDGIEDGQRSKRRTVGMRFEAAGWLSLAIVIYWFIAVVVYGATGVRAWSDLGALLMLVTPFGALCLLVALLRYSATRRERVRRLAILVFGVLIACDPVNPTDLGGRLRVRNVVGETELQAWAMDVLAKPIKELLPGQMNQTGQGENVPYR